MLRQKKCENCNTETSETNISCENCGAPFELGARLKWRADRESKSMNREGMMDMGSKSCPKCNTDNPAKSKFCGTCGTELNKPVDSTQRHLQRSTYSSLVEEAKQELEDLENVISENVNAGLRHAEENPVATTFTICLTYLRISKGIACCGSIYFLPYGIALLRNKNKLKTFALNLLVGWTIVGWVVALVLAIEEDTEAERTVQ